MSNSNTQNDFSKGSIVKNIMNLAIPMTLAQLINVLYNIVDRIYIGRIPDHATLSLTGIGLSLPQTNAVSVRRQRRYLSICECLHYDLSARQPVRDGRTWHELVHQFTGLRAHRHDDRPFRRCRQYPARPDFYLCASHGNPRRGARHHPVAASLRYLDSAVFNQ